MAPDLCPRATVLKLAHHGSNNGSVARWLEMVRPEMAVANVCRGNTFGHPGSETLALLARHGIPLIWTDRDGTVVVESDGRGWRGRGSPDRGERASRGEGPREAMTRHRCEDGREAAQRQHRHGGRLEALPGVGPGSSRVRKSPTETVTDSQSGAARPARR